MERLILPAPNEPMFVARCLVQRQYLHADGPTLVAWRGGWWQWRGSHWEEADEAAVRAAAYRFTEDATYLSAKDKQETPWLPNKSKIANLLEALRAVVHSDAPNMPCWDSLGRGNVPTSTREALVACKNGLLDVPARELLPHSPRYFNSNAVPFDYEPDAPKPERWLHFLSELWQDDPEAITCLQDWFGYVLSGKTDLHKILLLIGPRRSGKGTITRVLSALVGPENRAGPTLANLATQFGLQSLIGKSLATISDARLGRTDPNVVVERLLSISGEDALSVPRKNRPDWTGPLPVRFMFATNELPRLGDASGAMATRFVILTLTRSWLGAEDTKLGDALMAELPGIFNWALEGLTSLESKGRLTEPASSEDAKGSLEDLISPVSAFVRECCEVGNFEVHQDTLYAEWLKWADANGHHAGSVQMFGKNLAAVLPALVRKRPREASGTERRVPLYRGLRLSSWGHNALDRVPARPSLVSEGWCERHKCWEPCLDCAAEEAS